MPYTPPSHQSPASTKSNSPVLSRSPSYSEDGPRSPNTGRPRPPRSMSSSSYLHKHRRSPSMTKTEAAPPTPTEAPDSAIEVSDFAQNSSVRQSPPPVNNLTIPTGMVISPPDSSENSDGDDGPSKQRGRGLEQNWAQLKEAVRGIDQRRSGSPEKVALDMQGTTSEPVSQTTFPTALTTEARKISHSRSSTETAIIIPKSATFESPTPTSDDSDEDQGPFSKPSLVRKKSGELVKPALRPSSRRRYSSMPGTPTYSKSVHFNDSDNQTRHFLQVDKPIAVSAGTSPVETYEGEHEFPFDEPARTEREICLTNFPQDTFERKTKPIRVERIFLSPDNQTLIGSCAVQNIAFHKLVVARFTVDYWKTTSEVVAEYSNDVRNPVNDNCDRFNFNIKLSDQANIDNKTLLLCVRYNVNGQEYWDNNSDFNYQIDFKRVKRASAKPPMTIGLGARPLNAIPRSRHSPPATARGRQESVDDDFVSQLNTSSAYHFGGSDSLISESPTSVKLKPKGKRGSLFPTAEDTHPANGLGGRYDFGASLSAALTSAQDKLGRESGLMNRAGASKSSMDGYFGPQERKQGPTKTTERPDALTTDRPAMGSDQYKDLVQKFCYFTPGSGKPTASSLQSVSNPTTRKNAKHSTDGATDDDSASAQSSGTSSPSPSLDHDSNKRNGRYSTVLSPLASRSASPVPVTGHEFGARAASPLRFGYPYHSHVRDGYLSDSMTPTAIRG